MNKKLEKLSALIGVLGTGIGVCEDTVDGASSLGKKDIEVIAANNNVMFVAYRGAEKIVDDLKKEAEDKMSDESIAGYPRFSGLSVTEAAFVRGALLNFVDKELSGGKVTKTLQSIIDELQKQIEMGRECS